MSIAGQGLYCAFCGSLLDGGGRFCGTCGKPSDAGQHQYPPGGRQTHGRNRYTQDRRASRARSLVSLLSVGMVGDGWNRTQMLPTRLGSKKAVASGGYRMQLDPAVPRILQIKT